MKVFKKQCAGKIAHISESSAEYYLDEKRDFKSHIYKCSICNMWHTSITEKKDEKNKRVRKKS